MIPYMVGKLAPNLSHLTRRLVKSVPGRGYFRAVPSQNGDKYVTSPPKSLNLSFSILAGDKRGVFQPKYHILSAASITMLIVGAMVYIDRILSKN